MSTRWTKDKGDDVLMVDQQGFGLPEIEALRIQDKTGKIKASVALGGPDTLKIKAAVGAEGAVSANTIEVAISITDELGNAVSGVREVLIRSLAVTDGQGDLAAAGTPVGTLKKANNPATGENVAWMETTAAGLVTVAVTDTAAEDCMLKIEAAGCKPVILKLTYA